MCLREGGRECVMLWTHNSVFGDGKSVLLFSGKTVSPFDSFECFDVKVSDIVDR